MSRPPLAGLSEDPWAPEELDPELEAAIEYGEREGWQVLRHPLVYAVPYFPAENKRLNTLLAMKRANIERSIIQRQWSSVIFSHERPYRVQALMQHRLAMTHAEYWAMVRDVWVDSENVRQCRSEWRQLLTAARPGRRIHGMLAEDRLMLTKEFNGKPTATVWRGHGTMEGGRRMGLSWTFDRKKAEWFARRNARLHGHAPVLSQSTVAAADVLLAIATRGESEVVVLPSALLGVRRVQFGGVHKDNHNAASAAGATNDE